MNYNLEKFAKGLNNIIVRLNGYCRTCDLRDSLNPPLPGTESFRSWVGKPLMSLSIMDRNASHIGVLKFGIVYRGKQD